MTYDLIARVLLLGITLAAVETLHGIARMRLLAPRVGRARAVKLSIVSGSLLAFGVCFALVPRVGVDGLAGHLALGGFLAAFLAAYDLALGRWLLRRTWANLWQDFNPSSGNYLSFGLLLLITFPALVYGLRAAN